MYASAEKAHLEKKAVVDGKACVYREEQRIKTRRDDRLRGVVGWKRQTEEQKLWWKPTKTVVAARREETLNLVLALIPCYE
jgi:hypothetical protein